MRQFDTKEFIYEVTAESFLSYLMKCANEDRPDTMIPKVMGWIIAPTEEVAISSIQRLFEVVPKALIVEYSTREKTIVMKNGVVVECLSKFELEKLVGRALDAVFFVNVEEIPNLQALWDYTAARLHAPGRGINGKGGIALVSL